MISAKEAREMSGKNKENRIQEAIVPTRVKIEQLINTAISGANNSCVISFEADYFGYCAFEKVIKHELTSSPLNYKVIRLDSVDVLGSICKINSYKIEW